MNNIGQEKHTYEDAGRIAMQNPRIVTLLGGAGLTAVDLQFFNSLHEQQQSIFVHGSIMANRITPTSDIDFTVVGAFDNISSELKDTLMPGLANTKELHTIDYISTSIRSQSGRKISLHMSEPVFRDNYPSSMPLANEYRPGTHAKSGDRKYFLPGVDENNTVHLVNLLCRSIPVGGDGGTVTATPQTGRMILNGKAVYIDGQEQPNIVADELIRIRPDGEVIEGASNETTEIAILGLEFDKMQSDTLMFNEKDAEERLVKAPSRRSMDMIGNFTKTDPSVITRRLFGLLAEYWPEVKPNKSR